MKMRPIQINKALVPMKAHYFLWNAGTGPVVPYLSVYARQLGFSSVIVGLVYTILPIFGMLAKPLFGAISDRFHCQKKIFLFAQVLTAVAFLAIFYAPKVPLDRKVGFSCVDSESVFRTLDGTTVDEDLLKLIQDSDMLDKCQLTCAMQDAYWDIVCDKWDVTDYCDATRRTEKFTFIANVPTSKTLMFNDTVIFRVGNVTVNEKTLTPICPSNGISSMCDVDCSDGNINTLVARTDIDDSEVYGLYQFWVFLILMTVAWIGQAISVSIGDAICFEMLGDKPNRYGYQRLFGALGWGIFSAIAGVMIDALSNGKAEKDYISAFYMAAAFLVLDFLVSMQLQYVQKKISASIFKDVARLLGNVRIIVYVIWCTCVGLCTGLMWNFFFWLIEDLVRGTDSVQWLKTLQGLVMAIQCLGGELPFFFLSGRILKKIGHTNAMSLVLFALGIRFILYSVIKDPWWFLPIELSNGLTFGLFYACMASYASIVAPPGTEATVQGMVGAVFEGVGVSLGSFVGGLAYNTYKGPLTFRYFGYGSLIACVVHVVVQYILRLRGYNQSQNQIKSVSCEKIPENSELVHSNRWRNRNYGSTLE